MGLSTSFSGEPRRLLIFAPDGDPSLSRQRELLSGEEEGVRERDLRVEYLIGEEAAEVVEVRSRYGVSGSGFEALLVGRDGGVKLRSGTPLSAEELFGRIDGMPMRRREIREMREGSGR